jgi:hypothetical protein
MQSKKDCFAPHVMEITKCIFAACDICKTYSIRMKKLVELLSRFRELYPFAQVSMDSIGPLEKKDRFIDIFY